MDEIKIINKQIRSIVFELLFVSIIFVLALGVWVNPNSSMAVFSSSNKEQGVLIKEIEPLVLENIYPIDDERAISNNKKGIFKLVNSSNENSKYSIIYRVYNNSTLDYKGLKYLLNIDEKTYMDFLSNIQMNEKKNYMDFVLYNGELNKNNEKTFKYTMWLDKNVGNEAQNKSLSAQFVVKSYGTEVTMK